MKSGSYRCSIPAPFHFSPPRLLLFLLLPWSSFTTAQTYSQEQYLALITDYVDKTINIYDGQWAYTFTTYDKLDLETIVRRIDPSRPFLQSDRIVSINGEAPSTERLEQHDRRMQRRLRRRNTDQSLVEEERERQGSEKERFLALLIPQTLHLLEQDGDIHILEFRGMEPDRKKIYEHLRGTLILDTKNAYIQELQVRITEPFSPFLFMHIDEAYFSMRFAINAEGKPVQRDASWQLDGDIFYLKELDRDQEIEWSDIEKVTPYNNGF